MIERISPFLNAYARGIRAGATDNTAAIQALINAASTNWSNVARAIVLPAGTLPVLGTLTVPSGMTIVGQGMGATTLQVQAGRTTPLFDIDGKSNIHLAGFSIGKASGAAAGAGGYGVYVRGDSADVVVERVRIDALFRPFQIAGGEGTTPGVCRRITFRTCTGTNAQQFNFNVDDTDTLLLDDCYARGAILDGAKLRKLTFNVTIRGGAYTGNGVGYLIDPIVYAGDGIDAFAGGDNFTIDGAVCDGNYGSGVDLKAADLNDSQMATYGQVRNARLINLSCRNNLIGGGLIIVVDLPADLTIPVFANAIVDGGVFEGNAVNGMLIEGRNVTINHPLIRKNGEHGIVVGSRAFDVDINHPVCVANGTSSANTYSGIALFGTQLWVNYGRFIGKDGDAIATDAELSALTVIQRYGIDIAPGANKVFINWPEGRHLGGQTARDQGSTGTCIINEMRVGQPNTDGGYGSHGSLYVSDRASIADDGYLTVWFKTAGGRNTPLSGWTWGVPFAPVAALPTAAANLRGLTLRLIGGTGVADTFHVCRKNAAEAYEWKQITVA